MSLGAHPPRLWDRIIAYGFQCHSGAMERQRNGTRNPAQKVRRRRQNQTAEDTLCWIPDLMIRLRRTWSGMTSQKQLPFTTREEGIKGCIP